MKKWYLVAALLLASCVQDGKVQLKIYNWEGYIPDEIYAEFEKETGIKVVLDTIASNEELYAKVKSSGSVYDIVVPSLDYAQILYDEGLSQPVSVPNISNIDPFFLDHLKKIDPDNSHIVPFAYGPTVIAYDSEKITDPVTGYDIYENPKYKGRMTLLDDMREVMASALIIQGYKQDDVSPEALAAAQRRINSWRSNILRFDADNFSRAIASGEAWVVQGYPETIWIALNDKQKETIKFVLPSEGGTAYIDSFVVLKNAPNKEAAEKFIDFIHRPDIYARICDELRLVCINVPARKLATQPPLIPVEELSRATLLRAVSDEALAKQSKIWETMLAE